MGGSNNDQLGILVCLVTLLLFDEVDNSATYCSAAAV